jgi:indolepyruvate ferredoxin oxidoreductase
MRLLARGKRLRGTPFDPFGHTEERRTERRLRDEYAATVLDLADRLAPENHGLALRLAELPDTVRGFGPVKLRTIETYERERAALLRELEDPHHPLPVAAE